MKNKNKLISIFISVIIIALNFNISVFASEHSSVVSAKTPKSADEAALYWAVKAGNGYGSGAVSSPIIVDDSIVFCSGNTLYKLNKYTGEIIDQKDSLSTASNFNTVPPLYAEGMIFVGLKNGTIQAFNADTLESLWIYHDTLKGQPTCPIVYKDGYIYTGFWNSETKDANYVCVSVEDEVITESTEIKQATWTYTQTGGFYLAGAYSTENFLLVGTDDGKSGYLSDTSSLLSINPKTGVLIDKIENLNGDIRSSVSYDENTDRYYFTSKGGSFYSVAVNDDGTFIKGNNGLKEIILSNGSETPLNPAMSTSTPVIRNKRAYVGVSGTSAFTPYSGHNITVIDLESWKIAYTAQTKGYPQTSGLLTAAYEDSDGYSYVYFIDNYTPGEIRVIKDKPGVTSVVDAVTETYTDRGKTYTYNNCAPVLFTPSGAQAQYAMSSPVTDDEGTLYFKNDSAHIMALGSKIKDIEIIQQPKKTIYTEGESFNAEGMKVVAHLYNGIDRDVTTYVSFSDSQLNTFNTEIAVYYNHVMYGDISDPENGNKTGVEIDPLVAYADITVLTKLQSDEASELDSQNNSPESLSESSASLYESNAGSDDDKSFAEQSNNNQKDISPDTGICGENILIILILALLAGIIVSAHKSHKSKCQTK